MLPTYPTRHSPPPKVIWIINEDSVLSLALVSFPTNPHIGADINSSSVTLYSDYEGEGSLFAVIELQNSVVMEYVFIPAVNRTYDCDAVGYPFTAIVSCPDGSVREVDCPGESGVVVYTCPMSQQIPQCMFWIV